MKILDRYLLREFTLYLGLGLAGFVAVFIAVDVIEKMHVFLDHRTPIALVVRFYAFRAPEVVLQVLPVAMLLATFLSLGQLNKYGELTAMRAAGLPLLRILAPVLAVGGAAVILSLVIGEAVVPGANRERDRIYRERIQKLADLRVTERTDVTFLGDGGRIYFMRLYVIPERRMHEVSVQDFRDGELVRRIDAAEATWENDRWLFVSGVRREFTAAGERAEPFDRLAPDGYVEDPGSFARESRKPAEMNLLELGAHIERLRSSGARVTNYLVDLHLKLAFPLVNLIVIFIGAPIAAGLRLRSAALGFGYSVTIAFVYYAFMRSGQALGHSGVLAPYWAAWLGDLVFAAVGAVLTWRAHRR